MVVSFLAIFVFAMIVEVMNIYNSEIEDINRYTYHSSKYEYDEIGRGWLNIYFCIIVFFTYGLYFSIYIYILQFSKTISRCLLIGVCKVVVNVAVIIANLALQYFDHSFFFVALASITGFIHTYFIYTDFDFSTIVDFRKIEIDNGE